MNSGGEEVTSDGKSFHIRAPGTGKALRSTVESLTAGTNRLSVTEDRSLSVPRRYVGGARELLQVLRSVTVHWHAAPDKSARRP